MSKIPVVINLTEDTEFAEELAGAFQSSTELAKRTVKITENSIIIADLRADLAPEHKDTLQAGIDNESTLVLRNCQSEKLSEFALFGVNAESVVLKSMESGRRQDIVVVGAENGPTMDADHDQEATAESEGLAEQIDIALARGMTIPPHEGEVVKKSVDDDTESDDQVEQSDAILIARLVEGLNFRSRTSMTTRASGGLEPINASRASGRVIFTQKNWMPKKKGMASIFGSFTIEIAAVLEPVKSKYIKLTSVGTAVSTKPKWDGEQNRGYFTQHSRVLAYPGNKYTFDTNSVRLPTGWRRIAIAPETPNSTKTYTKTTGWSIGAKAGTEVSHDPKVTAALEASYSQSNSVTETIEDFRVKNYSSAAACDWVYEYSKVADSWTSMFYQKLFREARVYSLAALAKSTMFLRNESIYEAPANAQGNQRFIFYLGQQTARLWETGNWRRYHHHIGYAIDGMWQFIDVNLSMVRHP